MKFTNQIEIKAPLDRVITLFLDVDHFSQWQPDLIKVDVLSKPYGKLGSESELTYKLGNKEICMNQIITKNNLPKSLCAVRETANVWNLVEHSFYSKSETETVWVSKNEYKCSGFVRLLIMLMPDMFKNQSQTSLEYFKEFVESQ